MGAQQNIPILYTPISNPRDQHYMERYGIKCSKVLHTLQWSGLDWIIKHSPMLPVGSSKNLFLNTTVKKMFVVMLQFNITNKFDKWFCSEIISNKQFSFGIFQWEVVCNLQSLDPNVAFTLALAPSDMNRGVPGTNQLGIKISKNGIAGGANVHFGLLPPAINNWKGESDERSVLVTTNVEYMTFRLVWLPEYVRFQFQQGAYLQHDKQALAWNPKVPKQMIPQKPMKIRMGLSLVDGLMGTMNKQDVQVLVKGFSYRPISIQT